MAWTTRTGPTRLSQPRPARWRSAVSVETHRLKSSDAKDGRRDERSLPQLHPSQADLKKYGAKKGAGDLGLSVSVNAGTPEELVTELDDLKSAEMVELRNAQQPT